MFKSLILIVALAAGGLADLRKEDVADGACANIPAESGDTKFFSGSAKGEQWFMTMASEYGQRYNTELLKGRPALNEDELQIPEPVVVLSNNPLTMAAVVKDVAIKGVFTPTKENDHKESYCEVFRGVLNGKTDIEDPSIKWKLLGHPAITIIKADPKNQYIIINICSTLTKSRYWACLSKSRIFSKELQNKVKAEVKATGFYDKDSVYTLH